MTDLGTLMNRATAHVGHTTATTIDDDMTRGQRARRARRKRLGLGGLGGVAAVLTLVIGLPSVGAVAPASAVDLVAYTGDQPEGFTIDETPEGWHLYVSDRTSLVLSPEDDPLVHDAGSDIVLLEGRIAISLVAKTFVPTSTLESRNMTIDGTTARAYDMLSRSGTPSGTIRVVVPQGKGMYLSVQLPPELNWTDAETIRFIGGIDVDENALTTAG